MEHGAVFTKLTALLLWVGLGLEPDLHRVVDDEIHELVKALDPNQPWNLPQIPIYTP